MESLTFLLLFGLELAHELAHAFITHLSAGHAPAWLQEGLAQALTEDGPGAVPDAAAAGTRGLRRVMPGARPEAVRDIEWGVSQERVTEGSRTLARLVHDRMAGLEELRDRGTGTGDLAVLAGCSMPAVLVEVAFLSNATDASLLESAEFRSDVARSIAAGVADFRDVWRERDQ